MYGFYFVIRIFIYLLFLFWFTEQLNTNFLTDICSKKKSVSESVSLSKFHWINSCDIFSKSHPCVNGYFISNVSVRWVIISLYQPRTSPDDDGLVVRKWKVLSPIYKSVVELTGRGWRMQPATHVCSPGVCMYVHCPRHNTPMLKHPGTKPDKNQQISTVTTARNCCYWKCVRVAFLFRPFLFKKDFRTWC